MKTGEVVRLTDGDGEKLWRVLVLRIEGGPHGRATGIGLAGARLLRWMPGARSLAFAHDQRGANLWAVPLDGGPARAVTLFKDGKVLSSTGRRTGARRWSRAATRDGTEF